MWAITQVTFCKHFREHKESDAPWQNGSMGEGSAGGATAGIRRPSMSSVLQYSSWQ